MCAGFFPILLKYTELLNLLMMISLKSLCLKWPKQRFEKIDLLLFTKTKLGLRLINQSLRDTVLTPDVVMDKFILLPLKHRVMRSNPVAQLWVFMNLCGKLCLRFTMYFFVKENIVMK